MKFFVNIILLLIFTFFSNAFVYSQQDTIKIEKKESTMALTKSPSVAIYRSLILPGLGQLYVESYWKAPIVFAAAGTLIYIIIDNQIKFSDYDKRLSNMDKTNTEYQLTKLYREYYRDNRDMGALYLIGVYLLASVDAYVGAHLYDFQVDENLSYNIGLSALPIPKVSLKINF